MDNAVLLSERECIDIAVHFANGELGQISAIFTTAYLRDKPTLVVGLGEGGDARCLAMGKIQAALNDFLGGEVVKLKDAIND